MNGQQRRRVENDEIAFEGEWVSELSCDPAEAGKRISTSASFGIEYTRELWETVS
jgi:hypothetical protein